MVKALDKAMAIPNMIIEFCLEYWPFIIIAVVLIIIVSMRQVFLQMIMGG